MKVELVDTVVTETLLPRMRTWLVVEVVVACDEDCCAAELPEELKDDPAVPALLAKDPDALPNELLKALCDATAA